MSLGEGLRGQPQWVEPTAIGTEARQLTPAWLQPAVELDSRPTVDQQGGTANDVAARPSTGEVVVTGPPAAAELARHEEAVHQAFWSLLEDVGYEAWQA